MVAMKEKKIIPKSISRNESKVHNLEHKNAATDTRKSLSNFDPFKTTTHSKVVAKKLDISSDSDSDSALIKLNAEVPPARIVGGKSKRVLSSDSDSSIHIQKPIVILSPFKKKKHEPIMQTTQSFTLNKAKRLEREKILEIETQAMSRALKATKPSSNKAFNPLEKQSTIAVGFLNTINQKKINKEAEAKRLQKLNAVELIEVFDSPPKIILEKINLFEKSNKIDKKSLEFMKYAEVQEESILFNDIDLQNLPPTPTLGYINLSSRESMPFDDDISVSEDLNDETDQAKINFEPPKPELFAKKGKVTIIKSPYASKTIGCFDKERPLIRNFMNDSPKSKEVICESQLIHSPRSYQKKSNFSLHSPTSTSQLSNPHERNTFNLKVRSPKKSPPKKTQNKAKIFSDQYFSPDKEPTTLNSKESSILLKKNFNENLYPKKSNIITETLPDISDGSCRKEPNEIEEIISLKLNFEESNTLKILNDLKRKVMSKPDLFKRDDIRDIPSPVMRRPLSSVYEPESSISLTILVLDSWNDLLESIDTVKRLDAECIHCYVTWKDGTRSFHDSKVVLHKAASMVKRSSKTLIESLLGTMNR